MLKRRENRQVALELIRYIFVALWAVAVSAQVCFGAMAENGAAAAAPVAEPYLSDADLRMFSRDMDGAQKIYEFVLTQSPHSYEALWRLSRFYIAAGMAKKSVREKKEQWKKAAEYARQAIAIKPEGADGHVYLAIAMGKIATSSTTGEKVKLVWDIKKEAEKAIELDPNKQKAYLTLGAWHRSVAEASALEKNMAKMFFSRLPEASLEESLRLLLKAKELGGQEIRNYFELGRTYEALGDYASARQEYRQGLMAKDLYPEDSEIKERIIRTLQKPMFR